MPEALLATLAGWLIGGFINGIVGFGAALVAMPVVALGLDASESDPLQGLKVTGAGFHAMAEKIARLGLPTMLVQEGGYLGDDLGRLAAARRVAVLFVTHSIEEAIRVGTRILLLSPHPGQVKAELNSVPPELLGTAAAAELETRINDMLFVH